MKKNNQELIEKLSAIQHEIWSHWMKYLFSLTKTAYDRDGKCIGLAIPHKSASHWGRQMNTEYEDLTEDEKQSDRDQVYKFLYLVEWSQDVDAFILDIFKEKEILANVPILEEGASASEITIAMISYLILNEFGRGFKEGEKYAGRYLLGELFDDNEKPQKLTIPIIKQLLLHGAKEAFAASRQYKKKSIVSIEFDYNSFEEYQNEMSKKPITIDDLIEKPTKGKWEFDAFPEMKFTTLKIKLKSGSKVKGQYLGGGLFNDLQNKAIEQNTIKCWRYSKKQKSQANQWQELFLPKGNDDITIELFSGTKIKKAKYLGVGLFSYEDGTTINADNVKAWKYRK